MSQDRGNENNDYAKFWGVKEVYYGRDALIYFVLFPYSPVVQNTN